jgi:hypothetical protein
VIVVAWSESERAAIGVSKLKMKIFKYFIVFLCGMAGLALYQAVESSRHMWGFEAYNMSIEYLKRELKTDSVYGEMATYSFDPMDLDTLPNGDFRTKIFINNDTQSDTFNVFLRRDNESLNPYRFDDDSRD